MLFRLVLILVASGALVFAWRALAPRVRAILRARKAHSSELGADAKAIGAEERAALDERATRDARLAETLKVGDEVRALLDDADGRAVDEAIRRLARELDLLSRIEKALGDTREAALQDARHALGKRRDELVASIDAGILDLKELKLAVLEAAASSGGGGREVVNARVQQVTDRHVDQTAAHDELAKLEQSFKR